MNKMMSQKSFLKELKWIDESGLKPEAVALLQMILTIKRFKKAGWTYESLKKDLIKDKYDIIT